MALSKTEIFQKAREITGNKADRAAGESFLDDPVLEASIRPAVRDLNRVSGVSDEPKEFSFTATVNQQSYVLADVMPADFFAIVEIYRSGAHYPEHCDIVFNGVCQRGDVIPAGLQGSVFRTINDQARAEWIDRFGGIREIAGKIYLEPPPIEAEVIKGFYTTTAFNIGTLPDEAESALLYAACKAILSGMLNRVAGNKYNRAELGETISQQLKTLREQRDYYAAEYGAELLKLSRG